MESGSISVSDIALNCGFSDPLYFSKVFKKKYGVCPTEYLQGMPKSKVAELITKYVYTND
jgi:AraC-like DNA-binding protein